MSKKKRPFEGPQKKNSGKGRILSKQSGEEKVGFFRDRGTRETIESIVVAVMLALMFRAFEAEAFVIPTGSMAPTLEGRHLDTVCKKCGYEYLTGASDENPDRAYGFIFDTTCPICRYTQSHDRKLTGFRSNEDSFTGDRILVSKFAYDLAPPKRWDVIVFKFPGNPKQNYIKRLIGLPNETVMIINGDIYVLTDEQPYKIARKPPAKINAMLQLIDDTKFLADDLKKAGWPSRWQQWDAEEPAWTIDDADQPEFKIAGSNEEAWLRYKHIIPNSDEEWELIEKGELPERLEDFDGQMITDYYAYNDAEHAQRPGASRGYLSLLKGKGLHWVGDLALQADLEVESETGEIGFDLVEAGTHFTCWVDVSTGNAVVTSNDLQINFSSGKQQASAKTKIRKPGKYKVQFANIDNQLTLWIDGKVVEFDTPLTYERDKVLFPRWNSEDAGDAQPLGVGSRGAELKVTRLKVLRDIYYVADQEMYAGTLTRLREIAMNPMIWSEADAVTAIKSTAVGNEVDYPLGAGQFFPLGDNSPSSSDGRAWSTHYVDRDMLTGKALFIYWPHGWRPFWPNFKRMGFIR